VDIIDIDDDEEKEQEDNDGNDADADGGVGGGGGGADQDGSCSSSLVSQFKDEDYEREDVVEVHEEDGRWRKAIVYRAKFDATRVVLFFGGTEYEGLTSKYSYAPREHGSSSGPAKGPKMVLLDGDGDEIEHRALGVVKEDDREACGQAKVETPHPKTEQAGDKEADDKEGEGGVAQTDCASTPPGPRIHHLLLGRELEKKFVGYSNKKWRGVVVAVAPVKGGSVSRVDPAKPKFLVEWEDGSETTESFAVVQKNLFGTKR
jgi:hypothetical protein